MSLTETDKLKQRILTAKSMKGVTLPCQIVSAFCHTYPDYANAKGRKRVSDVLHLKYADEDITKKFEALAESVKINGYV